MISWLPVAVVLLAVAVALLVTIATPTIAQLSEPPPAGERLAGGLVGGFKASKVANEEDRLASKVRQTHAPLLNALDDYRAGESQNYDANNQSIHQWTAASTLNHTTNDDSNPNHHHHSEKEKKKTKQSRQPPTKEGEEVEVDKNEDEGEEFKLRAAIRPHQQQLQNHDQIEQRAEEAAKAQLLHSSTNSITSRSPIYTNQFVIQVEGGEMEARKLASKHGFVYLNHILGDYYHLEHQRLSKRSTSATKEALNISIEDEPQVLLLERQVLKRRVKRDFLELTNPANQAPAAIGTRLAAASQADGPTTWPDLNLAGGTSELGSQAQVQGRLHPQQQQQQQHNMNHQQQQLQLQQAQHLNNAQAAQRAGGHVQPAGRQGTMRIPQHHHYTRPANQAANQPRVATSRLLDAAGNGALQQELLETASSTSSSLVHHQQLTNSASQSANGPANGQSPSPSQAQPLKGVNATIISQQQRPTFANATAMNTGNSKQMPFNDPSWPLMWYLDGGAKNGFDLNVMAAWKMGYTGKGIVITILDDGLEKDHPDLQANYDPMASFDINGDDADPMPRYDANDSNRHGTRCAGEVAAVPDNNICSIGIAYNSKVGGVRMLDGDVTDAVEARSLSLNNQHIHIYSASWGPDDNGKTVDGPGEMATRAFMEGVTNGRQGLGSIFVFASGNGGREHDNCNCDGYTNSIWTLSISSATENGYVPWYIEACSSTLATTYSSGSYEERQIATTDLHHSCTSSHTGTSASAPLAAGICALVLESNPKLTWRDMQHIVVRTAKPANLVAKDWRTNAMGRNVSHAFGYGLMDAAAMITMAKRWTTVPMQYTCEVRSPQMEKFIPAKGYIELKLRAACENVRFLEHVQSKVTLTSSRRGDLHIYLISPHGTRSTLLAQRPHDQAEQGFRAWPFMTVHSWGESPNGVWTLEVHNEGKPQNRAYLKEWTLVLHGTQEDPNKHLDASTLTPPPPPALSSGLEPHHSAHLRPANKQQVVAAPPPPPLPALGNHFASNTGKDSEQPSHMHPPLGRPIAHWSTYPPPPPPLPPGVSPGATSRPAGNNNPPQVSSAANQPATAPPPPPPARPQSPQAPISTTTASYVTTFKTIVSSSSSTQPSSGQSPPDKTVQQQQQTTSLAGQRVQVNLNQAGGQLIKADFEVVSAPGNQLVGPSDKQHNHNQEHTSTLAHRPTVIGTASGQPGNQFNGEIFEGPPATVPSSSPRPPDQPVRVFGDNQQQDLGGQQFSKPAVIHLDGNKIELPMKPAVGMHDLLMPTNHHQHQPSSGTPQTTSQPTQQNELDGNQIDLKLSKDYRSSGDQSIYGTTTTATIATTISVPTTSSDINQVLADNTVGQSTNPGQNGASGAPISFGNSNQVWQIFVTLVTTTLVAIFHSRICKHDYYQYYNCKNHHLANTLVRLKV